MHACSHSARRDARCESQPSQLLAARQPSMYTGQKNRKEKGPHLATSCVAPALPAKKKPPCTNGHTHIHAMLCSLQQHSMHASGIAASIWPARRVRNH